MLFNEPKLLKSKKEASNGADYVRVSVLFNEPKLLKSNIWQAIDSGRTSFSALQRAEIAEMAAGLNTAWKITFGFSALQRAEIAEISGIRLVEDVLAVFQCSSTSRNC